MSATKTIDEYTPAELRLIAARKDFWTAVRYFNDKQNALIQLEERGGSKRELLDAILYIRHELANLTNTAREY